jgi:hypothetical protein
MTTAFVIDRKRQSSIGFSDLGDEFHPSLDVKQQCLSIQQKDQTLIVDLVSRDFMGKLIKALNKLGLEL